MHRKFIVAGVLATLLPGVALAQPDPRCVQSNRDSRTEGTVLGAVGGAILGGALAGGGHSTALGAGLGAVGGAVAGNAIAGARNQPCPPGYYYGPPPAAYEPPPPPPPGGYGAGWREPAPPPAAVNFWRDAPTGINERVDFMWSRIGRAERNGWLRPDEANRAYADLQAIRRERNRLYRRDGGLTEADRYYLQARLNHLGQMIHWMQRTGY